MCARRSRGEGTIYYIETKNLWVAQITLSNGKRRTKYGKAQKVVKQWLLEQRKALSDGIIIDDTKITFEEFVNRWFEDLAMHRLRPSTIDTHERIIRNHIKPTVGHIQLKN